MAPCEGSSHRRYRIGYAYDLQAHDVGTTLDYDEVFGIVCSFGCDIVAKQDFAFVENRRLFEVHVLAPFQCVGVVTDIPGRERDNHIGAEGRIRLAVLLVKTDKSDFDKRFERVAVATKIFKEYVRVSGRIAYAEALAVFLSPA